MGVVCSLTPYPITYDTSYILRLKFDHIISLRGKRFCAVYEQRTRNESQIKDRAKNGASKRAFPSLSFFSSRFISRAVKTENPVPLVCFAPKPKGNACHAGYLII